MANLSNTNNQWVLDRTITSGDGFTGTLNTAGSYVDKNIQLNIGVQKTSRTAAGGNVTLTAGSGSASVTAESGDSSSASNTSLNLLSTAPTTGIYYTITGTGSGTVTGVGSGNVSTGTGWVDSGTTNSGNSAVASKQSNTATTNKYINKADVSANVTVSTKASAAASGFTASTTATNYYVKSTANANASATASVTEGYTPAASASKNGSSSDTSGVITYIPVGALSTTASADVDKITNDNSNIGGVNVHGIIGTKTGSEPTSGYFIAMKATGGGNTAATAGGYVPEGTVSSNSANTTRYFPITTAVLGNTPAANQSKDSYPDKSSSAPVLISGDYLYINEGYVPKQKISLAQLVPNKSTVGSNTSSPSIRSNVSAYNDDGKLIAGTMPNANLSVGNGTINALTFTLGTNGNYSVSGSTTAGITVNTAGYISSSEGTKTSGTITVSGSVPATSVSHGLTANSDATTYPSGYGAYSFTATRGYNSEAITRTIPVYQGTWS